MNITNEIKIPSADAKRVSRWADLPDVSAPALFRVTDPDQEPREIVVAKHQRQVLEGLMHGPIYAASYCRVSDQVSMLRHDHGVNIRCDMFSDDRETGRSRYGVYFLESRVERIDGEGK